MLKSIKKMLGLDDKSPEGQKDQPVPEQPGQPAPEAPAHPTGVDGEKTDEHQTIEQQKESWFARLRRSLSKTRSSLRGKIMDLVGASHKVDEDFLEELEEILIQTDLGVRNTQLVIDHFQEIARLEQEVDPEKLLEIIREMILTILEDEPPPLILPEQGPAVILVVGVNGVGKTTSIAKLAWRLQNEGKRVLLAAADTFRAGAVEQMEVWASRLGVELIKSSIGADAAAVAFDAIQACRARGYDVLIVDTAGRFHTKHNLMEELSKIHRVIGREFPGAPHEILLVLDATTGQNAIAQAKTFHEAMNLTGLVLTKLDGTAKGGIVVAVKEEMQIPIKFIGIGEKMDDLRRFDPGEFAQALLS